ncbi:hypothetical protein [uncultured Phycicoccus sp.]|uniref:hypothetical protein n=1 Tax=uncultured Phycicoccus sp. TaxID=661422 RepID=UPI002617B9BC|nr:hypothetical protein [uncultured Phycicoccus sp.]
MTGRARSAVDWLLAPATEAVPRHQAVGATFLRILLGFLWLWNVNWKIPPDFGEAGGRGLYKFTAFAVSDPVLPPYSYVVEHVVLPNLAVFGWGVIVAETALAVLLLSGAWIRAAAALGIAQSLAIGLSVAFAPNEWPWAYLLMLGAHVALLASSSGRYLAVDAIRTGLDHGRTLGRVAGGVALAAGLVGVLGSFGDPLAASGPQIGTSSLEVGLGSFNLLGGAILLVVGGLLLATERMGARAAQGALVVALLAALLMRIQAGFAERLLGGGGTSATLLMTLAVVAFVRLRAVRTTSHPQEQP